jgi:prepilin-type N-terminal cleavage/methylation domain-containing protein/prepilin-type processing-associated H-X9-DG protein
MPKYPSSSREKLAFTLIELLVVVAIISIIAAILFPVFGRARENARRSTCQSNLKQIGFGILQYAQDYDETMVRNFYEANIQTTPHWQDVTFPYVKSTQLYTCPSDLLKINGLLILAPNRLAAAREMGSYAISNAYGDTTALEAEPPQGKALSQLVEPSTTLLVSDVLDTESNADLFWLDAAAPSINDAVSPRFIDATAGDTVERHLGTTNVLYCDGHVKSVRLEALVKMNSATPPVMSAFTIEAD